MPLHRERPLLESLQAEPSAEPPCAVGEETASLDSVVVFSYIDCGSRPRAAARLQPGAHQKDERVLLTRRLPNFAPSSTATTPTCFNRSAAFNFRQQSSQHHSESCQNAHEHLHLHELPLKKNTKTTCTSQRRLRSWPDPAASCDSCSTTSQPTRWPPDNG